MTSAPDIKASNKRARPARTSVVRRLVINIVLTMMLVGGLATALLFAREYQLQVEEEHDEMMRIANIFTPAIAHALWQYDRHQLTLLIAGLQADPGISYARVGDIANFSTAAGVRPYHKKITDIPLYYDDILVGELSVAYDTGATWSHSITHSAPYISSFILLLFALTVAVIYVIHRSVTRRITRLAHEVNERIRNGIHDPITIEPSDYRDEIDQLMLSFRELNEQLVDELSRNNRAQQQLSVINTELEDRVEERTQHLSETIQRLNQTLDELNATQGQLIEAEKLSALGGMIAGIGHEIETPLGLCLTMESCLRNDVNALQQEYSQSPTQLPDEAWRPVTESLDLLRENLRRASELMKSFKAVTAGQVSEDSEWIYLTKTIDDMLRSLSPALRDHQHQINVECAATVKMQASAIAINQIFTNLIMNSIHHGFQGEDSGIINIRVGEDKENIVIHYSDNGVGLSKEARQKIFEPLFTTRRGKGGTGLGMHLVYNIIKQRMKGEITLEPASQGVTFRIVMPKLKSQRREKGRKAIY